MLTRNKLLLVVVTAGLILCSSDLVAVPPQSQTRGSAVVATDRKTGIAFPKQAGAFKREGGIRYDEGGNPWGRYFAGNFILLDAFYYKDKSFDTEYANCRDYVKIVHPEARMISDGASRLRPSGRHTIFAFSDRFLGGGKTRVMSELIMFPHRDRYIKFRVTYRADDADRARQEIDSFVRAFKLP